MEEGQWERSLVEQLMEKHPLLFRGGQPRVASHFPAGWLSLADRLCDEVEGESGAAGCRGFIVEQVEDRFGTLSFYSSLGGRADHHIDVQTTERHCAATNEMSGSEEFVVVRQLVSTADALARRERR